VAHRQLDAIRRGETIACSTVRIDDAITRLLKAAADGTALNKKGRPYTGDAVRNLASALTVWIAAELGPGKPDAIGATKFKTSSTRGRPRPFR